MLLKVFSKEFYDKKHTQRIATLDRSQKETPTLSKIGASLHLFSASPNIDEVGYSNHPHFHFQ